MLRTAVVVASLTASLSLAGWSRSGDGEVTFDAKGNIGMKIHGKAGKLAVADDGRAITVSVKLADLDTENSLRNKHLLEDTEADKFPDITLVVPLDQVKLPGSGTAKGSFTLHGVTKALPFKYTATEKGGATEVTATAELNLKDFGIKVRSYLGVTVKPEVSIGARFSLKQ